MIVQLTGTLIGLTQSYAVLDVNGVGYELGISAVTAASLPSVGSSGVSLLTRLIVREDAQELYGFSTREERALFDRLRAISGVGPKLALATLSSFTPSQLASVVLSQDAVRMAGVPGVGKKKASRLLVELSDVFSKDAELRGLVGLSDSNVVTSTFSSSNIHSEATEALLSMGFTSQEVELALDGVEQNGASTIEAVLAYALKRLGRGN